MTTREDPRIPQSTNRQLRAYAQRHDSLRSEMMTLRNEIVEEIEIREAELRALNVQLNEIDKTIQRATAEI